MKKFASVLGLLCLMLLLPGCPGAQLETITSATTANSVTDDPSQQTYSWSVGQWSACSAKTCGTNGTQTRSVICKRDDGVSVKDSFCSSPKPLTSRACSAAACPVPPPPAPTYSWSVGAWSSCSAKTCGTNGTQTRSVVCKKNDGTTVADSFCTSAKPATSQACAAAACPVPTGEINVKDYGAIGNGIANDTLAIQNAIKAVKAGGTVRIPAGKYLVDVSEKNNLDLKSNMILAMDPNAIIKVKPNSLKRYYVFDIAGVSNVELYGGQVVGDRYEHIDLRKDPKKEISEWGYGVHVSSRSTHVRVHDMKISDMWGDGICVGSYPDDVVLQRIISTNNRRQGLSIGTATNVHVLDSEFSYTNGTPPMYGIDIEPDNVDLGNYSRNIVIENNYFHHNKAGGIQPYKAAENVTIKNNRFANMPEGIYIIGAKGGLISGNTFEQIRYEAIHLSSADSYQIENNVFQKSPTTSFVSITGLTGKATSYIFNKGAPNLKVLTNKYGN